MRIVIFVLFLISCDRTYFRTTIGNCVTERGFLYSKQKKYKVVRHDNKRYYPIVLQNVETREEKHVGVLDQYKDVDCSTKPEDIKGGW